jgi:hypothetical protein
MTSDIEMQNAATVMANKEEAVEHTERERRDREEIHRRDGFAMIALYNLPNVPSVPFSFADRCLAVAFGQIPEYALPRIGVARRSGSDLGA